MRRKKYTDKIHTQISQNWAALMDEHSGVTICIPESHIWDYAIPENYTNYQDGFLWEDCERYRGKPLIDHPIHGRLYIRAEPPMYLLRDGEREKYLCFDRHGNKYTVIVLYVPDSEKAEGNPSYFRFLPKVKKYTPKRKARKE